MKAGNFNNSGRKKRVLVAPLDWGLGHTTRCIPLIKELINNNCEVFLAAEGAAMHLLQQEFPQLELLHLKGYRMRYSRTKKGFLPRLILQFPKILLSAFKEHRWLKKTVREKSIDIVISDSRFGIYHHAVPCIYITHQLTIKTGNSFTERLAQKMHYHFINKYTACWVPDAAGEYNLAGDLSHPPKMPKTRVEYIGPLSRFEKTVGTKKYGLAIILSGPEPQRTIFEDLILKELEQYSGTCIFIRGLPGNADIKPCGNEKIEIHNHLSAPALSEAIQRSDLVICRGGYTTVMDLVKLQHKAILIPTPGQTEQEYLADYLSSRHYFYSMEQDKFSLAVVELLANLPGAHWPTFSEGYIQAVHDLISGFPSKI